MLIKSQTISLPYPPPTVESLSWVLPTSRKLRCPRSCSFDRSAVVWRTPHTWCWETLQNRIPDFCPPPSCLWSNLYSRSPPNLFPRSFALAPSIAPEVSCWRRFWTLIPLTAIFLSRNVKFIFNAWFWNRVVRLY